MTAKRGLPPLACECRYKTDEDEAKFLLIDRIWNLKFRDHYEHWEPPLSDEEEEWAYRATHLATAPSTTKFAITYVARRASKLQPTMDGKNISPFVLHQEHATDPSTSRCRYTRSLHHRRRHLHRPDSVSHAEALRSSFWQDRHPRGRPLSWANIVAVGINPRWGWQKLRLSNWAKRAQAEYPETNIRLLRLNNSGAVVPDTDKLAGTWQPLDMPPPPPPAARERSLPG
ncbi:hypothetical protein NW768_012061 [Fusarium equiseti]|uniref:Uncharacterized protein n=1 Tax=Fusarium equiseti TaxID=61235 RepID=A0ABQ8QVH2_FUSEQ|nr:hypothetical protein NW768_012061 [Fusarium equiseti]